VGLSLMRCNPRAIEALASSCEECEWSARRCRDYLTDYLAVAKSKVMRIGNTVYGCNMNELRSILRSKELVSLYRFAPGPLSL
jgi:hypothetical protein